MKNQYSSRILVGILSLVVLMSGCTTAGRIGTVDEQPKLSTREVANGFVRALFVDHNVKAAYDRYVSPDFVQHNPEIASGLRGDDKFFAERQKAQPEKFLPPEQWVDVIDHVLVDGDLFAVQHHVFTHLDDRGRAFVNIWRVKDGKIVEHWDVIQPVPGALKNEATMWCGKGSSYADGKKLGDTLIAPTCGLPDRRADRLASEAVIKDYMQMGLSGGQLAEAVDRFIAEDFIQHSPHIPQGKAALKRYFEERTSTNATAPKRQSDLVRMLVEGDLVLIHRHVYSAADPLGQVYADLFKVKDGKIVEHWDVIQTVPAKTVGGHTVW